MNIMDVLTSWLSGQMSLVAVLLWFLQQIMAAQG